MIRAIDLCCGAGGWTCAARGLPIQFVAVADWAADCLETWALNHSADHPNCKLLNVDIATPEGMLAVQEAASGVDLIVGAIPCEQFSCARANRPLKEGELEGVQALIDSVLALVRHLKPRWWCFEDVIAVEKQLPGPLMFGEAFECRRIQAADYGPQKRLRTFFGRFPELADPEPGPRILADVLRPGPYRTLPNLAKYKRSTSNWYGQGDVKKMRVQDDGRPGATVISSQGGMGSNAERSAMVPVAIDQPSRTIFCGTHGQSSRSLESLAVPYPWQRERPQDKTVAARTIAEGSGRGDGLPIVEAADLVRVMEWQEAALLQGFPPDYVFAASWSRTWKLVAQAIPVYVGRAILKGIVDRQAE